MIEQKAIEYFSKFPSLKILFLFDEAQEFLEEVQQIETSAFKVLFWENNPFVLKYQLTHEFQNEKLLLYLNLPQPTTQEMYHNFPLMGLLLANKELQLDNVGAFMETFGLQRHQKSMVTKYMSQLKYASVQEVVRPILTSGNFQEKELQQGLLSAFLKFKNVENWVVLITKLLVLAQEKNEVAFKRVQQKITTTNLEDRIIDKIRDHIGYSPKAITSEELLHVAKVLFYNYTMQQIRLSKNDAYSTLKIQEASQITAINQFWQVVESSKLVSKDFKDLLATIQQSVKGEQLVKTYGVNVPYAYYSNPITWGILDQLQLSILNNDSNSLEVLENLDLQQEIQGAVKETIRFLRHVLKTTLAITNVKEYIFNTPEEYIHFYTHSAYKIDTYYRQSLVYFKEIDTAEVPKTMNIEAIKEHLNATYNSHVDKLNIHWLQSLNNINFEYNNIQVPKQYNFYKTEVAPIDQKLVVIISDALRYEVAQELLSHMHADTKNTAEMRHLLASIPSKTNIGMAQLLPGEKQFNGGDILSDTITTASTNRTKILKGYKESAVAVNYNAIQTASRNENRELFKNELVYVYHDVIDTIGDKRVSERKTFDAAKDAILELEKFIKLLHSSYNVANVLITADHGFLYNDRKIEEKELEKLPSKTLISHNRFFITEDKNEKELAYTFPLSATTAFKEDVYVSVPFATNRYKKAGVGHQFVHGGASLQELITPLIISSRKRVEVAKKVNPTILNKGKLRVVSNILKFNILQENEVSRLEKERTIALALYKDTTAVSNIVNIVLNSTSEAPSDRLTNIELILNPTAINESVLKLKVFDVEDKLNPLIVELVTNNTLLGQDF